jgi:hypothetical protein
MVSNKKIQIWELKLLDKLFYIAKAEVGGEIRRYESSYNSDFDRNGKDAKKARAEIRNMILKDNTYAIIQWPWERGLGMKPKEIF